MRFNKAKCCAVLGYKNKLEEVTENGPMKKDLGVLEMKRWTGPGHVHFQPPNGGL